MSVPRVVFFSLSIIAFAGLGFSLGTYTAQKGTELRMAENQAQIDALRHEFQRALGESLNRATGTAGRLGDPASGNVAPDPALVAAVKQQLQREMGLMSVQMLRERSASFVELYMTDNRGGTSYGTAGYLGDGHFITVKHGVIPLGRSAERENRRAESIKLRLGNRMVPATVVDAGDAENEVDPGDWAIVRVDEPVDLPPLQINLDFPYVFAEPIVRLGNDYSKGIIASTGYVGQRANGLVTCLTDGHPGVSGGGVLNQDGQLVGIPVGRMQGDFRFSFILPLRAEMFRKVPGLQTVPGPEPTVIQAAAATMEE